MDQPGVYLDWNATAPPHPEVVAEMRRCLETGWANPASLHGPGRAARALVEEARQAVAALVRFDARDVTLTSSGTEANNLALAHPFDPAGRAGGALVVGAIEHPSVLRTADALEALGVEVVRVAPDPTGVVRAESFSQAIDRLDGPVRLLSLQATNHETGVIQPVAAVADIAHQNGAVLHVDAVQAVGKLEPDDWAGADLVTLSSHKLRGPKGLGAVATRPGIRLRPLLHGGQQERGHRPGTQDPVAAAGLAVAARLAQATPSAYRSLALLRDDLEARLIELGGRYGQRPVRNGTAARTGQVSNLSWPGWSGPELCAALDLEGVSVSSGPACSARTAEPAAAVHAMVGIERARSAIRISLGETSTSQAVQQALGAWERVLARAASA